MTMKLTAIAALACLAACKDKKDAKKDAQTFTQAMEIVCTEGAKEKITNQQAILVLEAVGVAAPAERTRLLEEAAKEAGLPGCPMIETLDPVRKLEIPELPGAVLDPFEDRPLMVLDETVVVFEGKQLEMERLGEFVRALFDANRYVQEVEPDLTVGIAADPDTSYGRLFAAVHELVKAGARPMMLARDGSRLGAIPIHVPDKAAAALPDSAPAQEEPLGMVVAVTTTEMIVWSMSQLEGTLQQPLVKAPHDRLADVEKALAEIAERRWAGKTRSEDDQRIVLMFDDAIPAQQVAAVMAAARKSFPKLLWSRGLE